MTNTRYQKSAAQYPEDTRRRTRINVGLIDNPCFEIFHRKGIEQIDGIEKQRTKIAARLHGGKDPNP